jgi:predicted ArsR family transcriptional regulator
LLALHSFCKRKDVSSGKCQTFVSVHRLAAKLGCSDREVKRRLRRLETVKAISTTTRKGTSNVYTLLRAGQGIATKNVSKASMAVDDNTEGMTP